MSVQTEYQGEFVSGTGNPDNRVNEVTADRVAILRNFIVGYDDRLKSAVGVIIRDPDHDFDCKYAGNTVALTDGMGVAYGYCAFSKATVFDILPPAVEQYHLIYLEIDKSVIPNACAVKIRNNQSSPYFDNAFRQDVLSTVKTGVFQLPLWRVHITNTGIRSVTDLRQTLHDNICRVYQSNTSRIVRRKIENGATCMTQQANDDSTKIA